MQDYLQQSAAEQAAYLSEIQQHHSFELGSPRNSLAFWLPILRFASFIYAGFFIPFYILVALCFEPLSKFSFTDELIVYFVYVPAIVAGFFHLSLKWYKKSKGDVLYDQLITLHRPTGMVYHPNAPEGFKRRPFAEYDAYYTKIVYSSGVEYYRMSLAHRTAKIVIQGADYNSYWRMLLDWQYFQTFMDIEHPLPDVASYEPLRPYDSNYG